MRINWLWDAPNTTEKKTKSILKNDKDPRFFNYAQKLLSRVKEKDYVFTLITPEIFCQNWPAIKTSIKKDAWFKNSVSYWQTIYNQTISNLKNTGIKIHKFPDQDVNPYRMNLAQEIRKIRLQAGYTQKHLAIIVGVKQPDISKLERGIINPSFDTLYKVAGACFKRVQLKFVK